MRRSSGLRYGSSFTAVTFQPQHLSSAPALGAGSALWAACGTVLARGAQQRGGVGRCGRADRGSAESFAHAADNAAGHEDVLDGHGAERDRGHVEFKRFQSDIPGKSLRDTNEVIDQMENSILWGKFELKA